MYLVGGTGISESTPSCVEPKALFFFFFTFEVDLRGYVPVTLNRY